MRKVFLALIFMCFGSAASLFAGGNPESAPAAQAPAPTVVSSTVKDEATTTVTNGSVSTNETVTVNTTYSDGSSSTAVTTSNGSTTSGQKTTTYSSGSGKTEFYSNDYYYVVPKSESNAYY